MNDIEIANHFSNRSEIYDAISTWVNNETILSSMLSCIPELPEEQEILNIVDLGAGTGAVSKYILKKYPFSKNIIAVDICEDMLHKISEPDITKYVSSLEKMPFLDNTFDVAVSRQCLHYIENLDLVIQEIKRILKDDSVFVLSQIVPLETLMKDYWSKIIKFRQPLRKHYFSENDWINLFICEGFSVLSIERFSHRGSVLKWASKYNITDLDMIDEHKKLLLNAPEQFIKEYNVSQNNDDVNYDSFWFVVKFSLTKKMKEDSV